ncbi:MAG: HesA/MoeB/ThiF family protein [Chitinophagaceae bacterium]
MSLSPAEIKRWQSQIKVKDFGINAQEKIKKTRILLVGLGSLGTPLAQYLSALGTGVIGLADYAVIREEDLSNQPVFQVLDIGKPKAQRVASRLWATNSWTRHFPFLVQAKPDNILSLIRDFDLIVDCSQNLATHFLINDAGVISGKPFFIGEVDGWNAWMGGFNLPIAVQQERSSTYRCYGKESIVSADREDGKLTSASGWTGLWMTNEILKWMTGLAPGLPGIQLINLLEFQIKNIRTPRDPSGIEEVLSKGLLSAEEYGLVIVPDLEE